jgi:hypothetical protein
MDENESDLRQQLGNPNILSLAENQFDLSVFGEISRVNPLLSF